MAEVVRVGERTRIAGVDATREWVIAPGQVTDSRVTVESLTVQARTSWSLQTEPDELAWIQVLAGSPTIDGEVTGTEWILMVAGGEALFVEAGVGDALLVTRVPRASAYDPAVRKGLKVRHDWSTEPVLDSEHDSRRRIYLASTGLWGTEAVKGEMIFYPAGSAGAAHHHEGAEHYQYVLAGTGTALLDGTPVELGPGDLLYNLENEVHAFENRGADEFVFVEFFVPGESRTVWVPGANACGWTPRTTDARGRPAARELEYHVHGQGQV